MSGKQNKNRNEMRRKISARKKILGNFNIDAKALKSSFRRHSGVGVVGCARKISVVRGRKFEVSRKEIRISAMEPEALNASVWCTF